MSLLLAFDTSGPHCMATLLKDGAVIDSCHQDMARGQAEALVPLLQSVLARQSLGFGGLDGLGVGIGPGNFTGIRIAVAAARGLAHAMGKPVRGVSWLEAQALGLPRPCLSLVDARRGLVYAQRFDASSATSPVLIDSAALATMTTGQDLRWVGAGAEEQAARFGGQAMDPVHPLSDAIAFLAADRLSDPTAPAPSPLYLRAPDAAPSSDPAPAILDA